MRLRSAFGVPINRAILCGGLRMLGQAGSVRIRAYVDAPYQSASRARPAGAGVILTPKRS